jgi:hypothetical protein
MVGLLREDRIAGEEAEDLHGFLVVRRIVAGHERLLQEDRSRRA